MSLATLVNHVYGRDGGQTPNHAIVELASEDYVAGDLLLVVFSCDRSSSSTLSLNAGSSSGWALDGGFPHSTGSFQGAIAGKIADDATENLTIDSSVTETATWELFIFRPSSGGTLNYDFSATPVYTTTGTTIVAGNLTPSGGVQDYWGILAALTDSTLIYSSASGAYAANFGAQQAISTSGASISSSHASHSAVSVVPGATFTAGGNRAGLALTIAVWESGGVDETDPIIDTLVTAPTSSSSTDLTFNTDDETGTGDVYALVSSNASETAGTVVAGGETHAAAASTEQSFTGLAWTAGQYVHVVHVDGATVPNTSNVLSVLITDAEAPVATGPLVVSNITLTGYRISGFEATDNLAVTGWRWRVAAGSWTTFNDTFFDVSGRTTDDVELVEVQARDAAGNWSNTLSKTVTVGSTTISITGLDFRYVSGGAGNNYSLKQALSPSRISCTLLWYEWRETQTVYSGGVIFCNDGGAFNGGQDVAMFVTHGCPGTFAADGQRNSGDTSVMHHEIAGLTSAAFGSANDYIASNSTLVQSGETQESFPAIYGEWVPRVARITTNGSAVEHENFTDWRDPLHVIRQNIATTDIADLTGERLWIGAPPWITNGSENFDAKFFFVKEFSRPLTNEEINTEFANFSNTPIVSDCWFSNIYPVLSAGVVPDLKGFGTDHPFVLYDGDTPPGFTEDFNIPAVATQRHNAWNGSAWVPGAIKAWNGSAWVPGVLKAWNGSAWV